MRGFWIWLGTLVLAASGVPAFAVPPHTTSFTVIGEGNTTCGQWADLRRQSDRTLPESAWVVGYVVAESRHHALSGDNLTLGLDGAAIDHWIDLHCATHPLDSLIQAAFVLTKELAARHRRTPTPKTP